MAYFRAMGGNSIQPYTVIVTCDAEFAGQEITMSQEGQKPIKKRCPEVEPYVVVFKPTNSGTWKISAEVDGYTFEKNVELAFWGEYRVTLLATIDGATVLPINDVKTWLKCAEIKGKSYTTISQVLSDTNTLYALISNENAVKYMARSTGFASSVCANQSAMTYIGLNNYCSNSLLDVSTWLNSICESTYFEKVLNVKIPTMTSNTAPSGTVSASSSYSGRDPYKAFSSSETSMWVANSTSKGQWLRYSFPTATNIRKVTIKYSSSISTPIKCILEGSSDGSSWTKINPTQSLEKNSEKNNNSTIKSWSVVNNAKYKHYRLYFEDSIFTSSSIFVGIWSGSNFYGRKDV